MPPKDMRLYFTQGAGIGLDATSMEPLWVLGARGPKEVNPRTQRGPKEKNPRKNTPIPRTQRGEN
jgi:hypothetical protein